MPGNYLLPIYNIIIATCFCFFEKNILFTLDRIAGIVYIGNYLSFYPMEKSIAKSVPNE